MFFYNKGRSMGTQIVVIFFIYTENDELYTV